MMNTKYIFMVFLFSIFLIYSVSVSFADPLIINHLTTDITSIPESAINQAKETLHIAYGHTSHGSQLTSGMTGLVNFMNGLGYTEGLYAYDNGGTGGAMAFT